MSTSAGVGARRTGRVLRERYVLETRLEQGRFGTLYKAFDRLYGHGGREHVSILTLPAEIGRNPAQLGAFRRGFETVSGLSHPNIVELYELDSDGADRPFVVLEWIDGESLRSIVDSLAPETVCEADALNVVRAVGNALIYAHAKGVVHGDIRPENVIVTEHGEVMVLFASACLATNAPFPVSARDDVRGLATLAYEMMSGVPPLVGGFYYSGTGNEPAPIDGLDKKRWKALKSALSLRDGRISSVRQLLAALDLEARPVAGRVREKTAQRAPDIRRSGIGRRAVMLVGLAGAAVALVGGVRLAAERLPEATLSEWSARFTEGIDRSAGAARAGLAEVRAGIGWAANVAAAYWERRTAEHEAGTDAPNDSANTAQSQAAPEGMGHDAVAGIRREHGYAAAHAERSAAASAAREHGDESDAPQPPAAAALGASALLAAGAEQGASPSIEHEASPGIEPTAASAVYFSAPEYSISESGGVAVIEVRRDDPRGTLSFVWWTRDDTAVAGEDYADLGRVVEQFDEGETVRRLYVPIISDAVPEEKYERFEVLLGVLSPEGSQIGPLQSVWVTIIDDD